ncbi:MAG: class II aldolase/adducin family protein [Deltaproteobacteria bacterium]|nr:class II aldolase/adducin family protein [Deltaproteobacteria bacterium]
MALHDKEKKEVLDACLWLSAQGFFGSQRGSGGNVSVRAGAQAMAITPSSVRYQEMATDDICILGLDGSPVDVKPGRRPSMESAMHGVIYRQRSDVNAVVHTHQPYASVFAVLNLPIPALFDEVAWTLGSTINVIPYALSGSPELAANVAARLADDAGAYIIQNHGILALGADLDRAMHNAELLEKVAHIYWMALSTGQPVSTLPAAAIVYAEAKRRENPPAK